MQIYDWILNFGSFGWVMFGILFIIPSIFGIYEANQDQNKYIYSDYTDILLAAIFVFLPIIFTLLNINALEALGAYEQNATILSDERIKMAKDIKFSMFFWDIAFILLGIVLVVKGIYLNKNNKFLSLYSAICSKFFFPLLIVAVFIIYKFLSAEPSRPERKKYKTSDEYQAALARYKVDYEDWKDKKARNAFLLAGATTGLILVMRALTKEKNFVNPKQYLNFKNQNITNESL